MKSIPKSQNPSVLHKFQHKTEKSFSKRTGKGKSNLNITKSQQQNTQYNLTQWKITKSTSHLLSKQKKISFPLLFKSNKKPFYVRKTHLYKAKYKLNQVELRPSVGKKSSLSFIKVIRYKKQFFNLFQFIFISVSCVFLPHK